MGQSGSFGKLSSAQGNVEGKVFSESSQDEVEDEFGVVGYFPV